MGPQSQNLSIWHIYEWAHKPDNHLYSTFTSGPTVIRFTEYTIFTSGLMVWIFFYTVNLPMGPQSQNLSIWHIYEWAHRPDNHLYCTFTSGPTVIRFSEYTIFTSWLTVQ